HADGQRLAGKIGILFGEIIAQHSVNHASPVHFARSGKDFAAGQVAPFLAANDATGLHPAVVRVQCGSEVTPSRILCSDLFCAADDLYDLFAQCVHAVEVGAHALQHDLAIDIHHVSVPHAASVHDVGHLHARLQFIALRMNRKNADL